MFLKKLVGGFRDLISTPPLRYRSRSMRGPLKWRNGEPGLPSIVARVGTSQAKRLQARRVSIHATPWKFRYTETKLVLVVSCNLKGLRRGRDPRITSRPGLAPRYDYKDKRSHVESGRSDIASTSNTRCDSTDSTSRGNADTPPQLQRKGQCHD